MADDQEQNTDISRRNFVTLSVAAGFGLAAGSPSEAAVAVVEDNVTIKTPDGTCDAAFIHPANGAHAAVIIWPDAFGLRPSMRNMAKRLAAESGYSVLVPNPYYRVGKAPMWEDASKVDFTTERPRLNPMMASINAAGTVEKDAPAFIAWLDQQPQVDRTKKVGTQGYCMGGALVVRTAAAVPDRVGAGASFHGGGLVNQTPTSPHLLAPRIKGRMYFGIAINDDMNQPTAKTELKAAFDAAKVPAEVEVYDMAQHGWCVPDMPNNLYSKADAERAWGKLLALYKAALS
jgi:carboxymethylenebutenolidase